MKAICYRDQGYFLETTGSNAEDLRARLWSETDIGRKKPRHSSLQLASVSLCTFLCFGVLAFVENIPLTSVSWLYTSRRSREKQSLSVLPSSIWGSTQLAQFWSEADPLWINNKEGDQSHSEGVWLLPLKHEQWQDEGLQGAGGIRTHGYPTDIFYLSF
jgi:hypothetical protein